MAQFASDDFEGTNGTELSAYNAAWTRHTSYTGNSQISANRLRPSANVISCYWHSGSPATADYSTSADLFMKEASGGSGATGVVGRVSTSANTFYMARYSGGADDAWQLYSCVAGTFTLLGSSAQALTDETGYNVKLEMIGTAIKLYTEGSGAALISATDSSITAAGKGGVRLAPIGAPGDTVGIHIDNFSADEDGGATAPQRYIVNSSTAVMRAANY